MHAGSLRLQTHTVITFDAYCFTAATMITRMRVDVTFIRILLVLLERYLEPTNKPQKSVGVIQVHAVRICNRGDVNCAVVNCPL